MEQIMQFSFAKVSPAGALVSIPLGEHADTSVKRTAAGSAGECLVHRHRVMGATVGYAVGHQMAKKQSEKQINAKRTGASAQNDAGMATPELANSKNCQPLTNMNNSLPPGLILYYNVNLRRVASYAFL